MNSTVFVIFDIPPADPWTKHIPLLNSAWPVTLIVLAYLLFVLKYGKIFMENRKPYNLKNVILAYNICQVIYNAAIFIMAVYYLFIDPTYDLYCIDTLSLDHPRKNIERWLTYAYFLNKVLDLMDTLFFVLRKSYKQITPLHVYHHMMIVYTIYWTVRFYGVGGQYNTMGLCNSFVHTVMYFYYFISAMRPGLKSSLWWKKYITRIQIGQFIILFMQAALGVYYIILHPAYDLRCMEPGAEDHPDKSVERWITCSYFLNKVLDLLDTVFFVLRKSYKQITILHVYHHVLMVFGVYWLVRLYGVGGQYMMTGFFNSFVHTVMYFYYFISAMYPELKSSLWWKKYITRIQIGQFILFSSSLQ
ncbi:elongation of very long chain fatty acids protein F-like [Drosophila novamexicana]|uniref:elongation of very long chain fatty acids protein F-like n=1 Tax=Drosophila novamexicana TaxID=47314 RepID=UPI0011E5CED7|nr:elongation of very long chain fatty acids protein F-like [Drosophila novamexicana]